MPSDLRNLKTYIMSALSLLYFVQLFPLAFIVHDAEEAIVQHRWMRSHRHVFEERFPRLLFIFKYLSSLDTKSGSSDIWSDTKGYLNSPPPGSWNHSLTSLGMTIWWVNGCLIHPLQNPIIGIITPNVGWTLFEVWPGLSGLPSRRWRNRRSSGRNSCSSNWPAVGWCTST